MAREIEFSGKTYPSMKEAARANGITYSSFRNYMDLPPEQGPNEVTIRGVTYPTQKAAAEALGLTPQAISEAKRRGQLQTAGLGTNWRWKK